MASGRSYVCHSNRCAALIASTISPSDGRNNSNLEHVTWSDPTVTPSRLAISSRLSPSATSSLIFSIACGINLTRLPLADELAFVIVMAALFGRVVVVYMLGFVSHARCDGPHKMADFGAAICKFGAQPLVIRRIHQLSVDGR